MAYDPLDAQSDPFRPPAVATLVACLHCRQVYESYEIEWRIETNADDKPHGFWCCPHENCGGQGFGFDILPIDPEYRDERGGWMRSDDDEEGDYDDSAEPNGEAAPPVEKTDEANDDLP